MLPGGLPRRPKGPGRLEVINDRKSVTYDLIPDRDERKAVGTMQMAEAVIERLADN